MRASFLTLLLLLLGAMVASAETIHRDRMVSGGEPASASGPQLSWAALGEPVGGRMSGDGFTLIGGGFPSVASGGAIVFEEADGQVVLEAEHFDLHTPRNGKSWVLESGLAGYSGQGYMTALPNSGVNNNTGYVTNSPELQHRVRFSTPGTYYVWVRGYGSSASDDSIHAGLDGVGPTTADRISLFPASWTWSRNTMDGPVATLNIAQAGHHTIHLWMREDGFRADKLLLRTNSSSTAPSGLGPPESRRIANSPPGIITSTPSDKTKVYMGDKVTLSMTATDPDHDPLRYRFLVDGVVLQDWAALATFSWDTATAAFGWRTVRIEVSDGIQTVARDFRVFVFWRPPL